MTTDVEEDLILFADMEAAGLDAGFYLFNFSTLPPAVLSTTPRELVEALDEFD